MGWQCPDSSCGRVLVIAVQIQWLAQQWLAIQTVGQGTQLREEGGGVEVLELWRGELHRHDAMQRLQRAKPSSSDQDKKGLEECSWTKRNPTRTAESRKNSEHPRKPSRQWETKKDSQSSRNNWRKEAFPSSGTQDKPHGGCLCLRKTGVSDRSDGFSFHCAA